MCVSFGAKIFPRFASRVCCLSPRLASPCPCRRTVLCSQGGEYDQGMFDGVMAQQRAYGESAEAFDAVRAKQAAAGPSTRPNRVSVCVARTLNAAVQSQFTLSLR